MAGAMQVDAWTIIIDVCLAASEISMMSKG